MESMHFYPWNAHLKESNFGALKVDNTTIIWEINSSMYELIWIFCFKQASDNRSTFVSCVANSAHAEHILKIFSKLLMSWRTATGCFLTRPPWGVRGLHTELWLQRWVKRAAFWFWNQDINSIQFHQIRQKTKISLWIKSYASDHVWC